MLLYQSYRWGDVKAEQGFDPRLSSPGHIPCISSGLPLPRVSNFAREKNCRSD